MKPIAIFRHAPSEGPGYFATYLDRHRLPWSLVKVDEGGVIPADPGACSGLVFMGGPMSVNDDLPWIPSVLRLIQDAVEEGVPTLGHCLGGQLIARALGGRVTKNPVKEIGWGRVDVLEGAASAEWFGTGFRHFDSFHWHGETFSIPAGATRIAASRWCENQAFVLGPHLALQCHVEMTPQLIHTWCRDWGKEVESLARRQTSVQTPAEMTREVEDRVKSLNAVADRLYDRWTASVLSGAATAGSR